MYPGKAVVRVLFTVVALSIVLYMGLLWRGRYLENCSAVAMADIIGGVRCSGGGSGALMILDNNGRLAYNKEILENSTVSEEVKEEKRCEVKQIEPIALEDYGATLSSGFIEEQKEKMQKIQGIQDVKEISFACDMKLDWDNNENSEFRINQYIEDELSGSFALLKENTSQVAEGEYNKAFAMIPNDLACYEYVFYGLEESEATDRELCQCGKAFDSAAFWAGEQGILFAIPDDGAMSAILDKEHTNLEGVL